MIKFVRTNFLISSVLLLAIHVVNGQEHGYIKGTVHLDSTWEQKLYLSHIPTFDDLYLMSKDMILSSAEIDSTGKFEFDISFLPEEENFFRLHVVKKNDSPTSLIIGGKDENHIFLSASRSSEIILVVGKTNPPFSHTVFEQSLSNKNLHLVTSFVKSRTDLAAESDAAKRRFIENDLRAQLANIADSSSNYLLGLYALYLRDGEIDYSSNSDIYESFNAKWKSETNPYLKAFRSKLPVDNSGPNIKGLVAGALLLLLIGFVTGRWSRSKQSATSDISKLSIQERKIYNLLRQGASNQEISDECNIGVSTVKTHVSSIYNKLKVRSRKDVMNLP